MSHKQQRTQESLARQLTRRGKRGLALVVFGLFLVGAAAPPVASAQSLPQPVRQVVRPMDGQGDSPLMP